MSLIPRQVQVTDSRGALIGYKNLLVSSDVSGAEVVLNGNTFQRYVPPGGAATVRYQLNTATLIDFVGIAAHNFGTHNGGVPVEIKYSATVGGALTTIGAVNQKDNRAVMLSFDPVTAAEIAITHSTTSGLEYGVVYAGQALQMQRPIYGGHSPISLSAKHEYQSSISETGQFLGRTVTRKGLEGSIAWKNLNPDWYRENFQPFVDSSVKAPAFIKWRPDYYPDEVIYSWITADASPNNSGGGSRLMDVSINVRAHSDV